MKRSFLASVVILLALLGYQSIPVGAATPTDEHIQNPGHRTSVAPAAGSDASPAAVIEVVTKSGYLRNKLSGKCIDVKGLPGTANGTVLQCGIASSASRTRTSGG